MQIGDKTPIPPATLTEPSPDGRTRPSARHGPTSVSETGSRHA
ncbi:hypothetical protein [Methylobacterium sp. Leaf108]|nr:hypothetical protein [Methylobacterium sp. Leaf108]